MKLKNLNIIISAITIVATIAIAYLTRPIEPTSLFYINTCIIILLELLVINAIYIVSKSESYTPQNLAVARLVVSFSLLSLVWFAIYTFLLVDVLDVKWYYVVYIVLIVVYTTLSLVTHKAGQVQISINEQAKANITERNNNKPKLFTLKHGISSIVSNSTISPTLKTKINSSIELLTEKLRISASNLCSDSVVETHLVEISTIAETLKEEPSNEELANKLYQSIRDTIQYVNLTK